MRHTVAAIFLALGPTLAAGCEAAPDDPASGGRAAGDRSGPPATGCDAPAVRAVVTEMGERLKQVSLLGPDSLLVDAIRERYSPLVTRDLLERWLDAPDRAPGRLVSSPWPERIEIDSITPAADGTCLVVGEIVHVSSTDTGTGAAASRVPVAVHVTPGDPPLIAAFDTRSVDDRDEAEEPSVADAAAVLRLYYDRIDAGDYRSAYELWAGRGAASGQDFDEFAEGFAATGRAQIDVGPAGRVEGAAGSRFVTFPVVITATTLDGREERFEGAYTLCRSAVDGATPEQREWRIHSASIRRVD